MIYVHLAEGFEEVEALTIVDVLRRAELEVQTVSVTGRKKVFGTHGVGVEADLLYEEADYTTCGMIVLPGGMPGASNLQQHEGLKQHILCFAENGKKLAAICAAPMIFGALGLLEGKNATIYPGMEEELKGATASRQGFVKDGNVLTGRGPAYAMEFALGLVEDFAGKKVADQVAEGLLYHRG